MADGSFPVDFELVAVLFDPFSHESKRTCREETRENVPGRNLDLGALLAIAGVEVWRRMIAVVHLNHDSVKAADVGHPPLRAEARRLSPIVTNPALSLLGGDSAGVGYSKEGS